MHVAFHVLNLLFTEAPSKIISREGGCQKAIFKKGKQEEKAEVCQSPQELSESTSDGVKHPNVIIWQPAGTVATTTCVI